MRKLVITGAAVLATAGVGIGMAQLANADSTTPTPEPSTSGSTVPGKPGLQQGESRSGTAPGKQGHPGEGRQGGIDPKSLAEKLGVEESTLQEALAALRPTDAGKPDAGTSPQQDRTARETALAKALAEKLDLEEATVSSALSELRAAADADRAAAQERILSEAVTNGTLTQAEADGVAKAVEADIVELRGGGRR